MKLYDEGTVDQLRWPNSRLRDYFSPMVAQGVEKFVENVSTRLYFLHFDEHVLPLTVNEKDYENAYVVSTLYAHTHLEEKLAAKSRPLYKIAKPFFSFSRGVLKWCKVNQVVCVNNWLVTTSMLPPLTPEQCVRVAHFLRQKFPKHAITFRNLNSHSHQPHLKSLKKEGLLLVKARAVFLYEPEKLVLKRSRVAYHRRRDLGLIKKHCYEVIRNKEIGVDDVGRLTHLYRSLYVEKYTPYSAAYTEDYLRNAIETGVLKIFALKKEGQIDGVIGYMQDGEKVCVTMVGYDSTLPQDVGLYRMLNALVFEEVDRHGYHFNNSSAADTFKSARGMVPIPEYTVVDTRGLSPQARCLWKLVEKASALTI